MMRGGSPQQTQVVKTAQDEKHERLEIKEDQQGKVAKGDESSPAENEGADQSSSGSDDSAGRHSGGDGDLGASDKGTSERLLGGRAAPEPG